MRRNDVEVWQRARQLKDDYPIVEQLLEMVKYAFSETSRRTHVEALRQAIEDIEGGEDE